MKLLAIETATPACSAALMHDQQTIERFQIAPRQHAQLILTMVDELLAQAGVSLNKLDAIAVGQGPGSFMGVRLAVGVAQGLAFGADLPVIPVSTLAALAQTAYDQGAEGKIIAAWDARMDEMYWGAYELDNQGRLQCLQTEALNKPAEIQLPSLSSWTLVGNAWEVYRQQLSSSILSQHFLPELYPRAAAVAKIALQLLETGSTLSPENVVPIYLRNDVAKPQKD